MDKKQATMLILANLRKTDPAFYRIVMKRIGPMIHPKAKQGMGGLGALGDTWDNVLNTVNSLGTTYLNNQAKIQQLNAQTSAAQSLPAPAPAPTTKTSTGGFMSTITANKPLLYGSLGLLGFALFLAKKKKRTA